MKEEFFLTLIYIFILAFFKDKIIKKNNFKNKTIDFEELSYVK